MVAARGDTPWPHSRFTFFSFALQNSTGMSPPGPFWCGSSTWRQKPTATAASKALPPRSSTLMPTAEPIQCVDETTPKVPWISGRVVKIGSKETSYLDAAVITRSDRYR